MIERPRIYLTGSCEGFDGLRESLSNHGELDVVGWSETVSEAASALAGGHLEVVLHATRHSELPADDLAQIREHTQAPIILVPSCHSPPLLQHAPDPPLPTLLLLPHLLS